MAQANYVPTAICTRITGARAKASTSAWLFPVWPDVHQSTPFPNFETPIALSAL